MSRGPRSRTTTWTGCGCFGMCGWMNSSIEPSSPPGDERSCLRLPQCVCLRLIVCLYSVFGAVCDATAFGGEDAIRGCPGSRAFARGAHEGMYPKGSRRLRTTRLRRPVATYLGFPLASRERVEGHWAALFLRFWFLELR